nr:RNA-directed DNA polymerase, eukaryota, reverse transcriptase zinc-binding domain protein [Tanacetum cinerariifolium]
LFALEGDKQVSVFDKISDTSLIASFRRTPREGIKDSQLYLFVEYAAGVILTSHNDMWVWTLESSGSFRLSRLVILLMISYCLQWVLPLDG